MRIGIFGTFDVENYGDLLFPLLAEMRLRNHLPDVTLDPFSPVGGPSIWEDCPSSIGCDDFFGRRDDYQGILVGGGNIIRVTPSNLESYDRGLVPVLGYANLWVGVAAENNDNRIPICWNAPGAPTRFPPSLHPLLRACLKRVDYVSVRDDPSHDLLKEIAPEIEISIVPDPAWEIDKLWTREALDVAYRSAFTSRKIAVPDRSIVIHVNSRYLGEADAVAAGLDGLCHDLQAKGILIAIGPCHGDGELARAMAERMTTAPLVIDRPASLKEVASCISRSVAYIGSSMHGFITASAFHVPAVVVASPQMIKFPGLLSQIGLPDLLHQSWLEAIEHVKGLVSTDYAQALHQVRAGQQTRLDAHWSKITALLQHAREQPSRRLGEARQNRAPPCRSAMGYRETLLGTMAMELFSKNQSIRQRHEAKARELEKDLKKQADRATALAARLETRDTRIAELANALAERDSEARDLASRLQAETARASGLAAKLEARDAEAADIAVKLRAEGVQRRNLKTELAERDRTIRSLRNSTSWRITAPLRALSLRVRWLARNSRRAFSLLWWLGTGQFNRAVMVSLPYYQRYVPRRIKELMPNKLREAAKRRLMDGDTTSNLVDTTPASELTKVGSKSLLQDAIASAEAASKAKNWPEAVSRWQAVIDRFGEKPLAVGIAKTNISIAQRLSDIKNYKYYIDNYNDAVAKRYNQNEKEIRIVIYTAISGGYDFMKLPEIIDPRFSYVLFTDSPAPDTGVFKVKPMTYLHKDAVRAARFVKTHPHILLKNYDIAVWIDANIMILGDICPLVEEFLVSGKAVAAVPHPTRRSIYEEVDACIQLKKDDAKIMQRQLSNYRSKGFNHDDLIESNFMMFDLRSQRTKSFLDRWWTEIDRGSRRDQLSLNYALKESDVDWHPLMNHPNSVRNHPCFALVSHGAGDGSGKALIDALQVPLVDPYSGPSYAEVRDQRISAQQNCEIDIIVCVHNALADVKCCLESLQRTRRSKRQRLIIIDDGSDLHTARYLKEFASKASWIELHRNSRAQGYTKAANQGLAASGGDLVILLNSDTVVTDGWAEKLADAVFSMPGAGIVGPMSNAASHQSIPDHQSTNNQTAINDLPPGVTAEDMNRYCEQWTVAEILPRVPLVHGFCFGVTRDVINKIGLFDETNFPYGYGEENDYCFRSVEAGFGLVIATHTYVYHGKSKSYADGRLALAKAGTDALEGLYGRDRIRRATKSMENNPLLENIRKRARDLVLRNSVLANDEQVSTNEIKIKI